MRVIFTILSLLFTCLLVCADVVMYTRTGPPTGWQIQARAPQNAQLTFILALKQQNLDELDSAFWAISDPQSPRWRHHMSKEEINKMIAPDPQDVKAVYEWLYSHGVDKKAIDSAGDALEVKTTVQIIEKLFQTEMYVFSSFEATTNKTVIRQYGSYSVPDHIRPCIDLVAGLSTFPVPRLGKPRRVQAISPANSHSHSDFKMNGNSNGVDMGIIPQSVYAQYNISAQTTGSASTTTSQAVIEFEQQYFLNSDITTYAGLTGLTLNTVPTSQIIGANGSPGTMEGSLDIQLLAGVNTEASSWYWLEPQNTWFYGFALHFFNTTTIPQVIAISYGWYEGDECDSLVNPSECTTYGVDTWGYIARTNTEFQKIGARGVSVIVASGDSGTHSETDETCTVNNGYFRAEYPASSPYVTSVGATMFYNSVALSPQPSICTSTSTQCAGLSSETAVVFATATFSSGGGFSAQMPAPSYQRNAIQQYFASGVGLPPAAYYNASGRGIPDVAAVGHKILIHYSGINEAEDGTSASAPIFAAVISLLNQQSIAKNGSTLGFLNPLLYQMAAAQPNTFNDITTGDNNCTMYGCYAGCHGFSATTGWDPVTGLGSPNYGNMLTYLKNNL